MRGLRNNNPLNIRHGKSHWQGMSSEQTDPAFVTFSTMAHGYRAAWVLMNNYRTYLQRRRMRYCLRNIIYRWAPPAENDTQAYVRHVIHLTGCKHAGLEELPPPTTAQGKELFKSILAAMTCVENGIDPEQVPQEEIERGYILAFGQLAA